MTSTRLCGERSAGAASDGCSDGSVWASTEACCCAGLGGRAGQRNGEGDGERHEGEAGHPAHPVDDRGV
jgi:hypothetical protein